MKNRAQRAPAETMVQETDEAWVQTDCIDCAMEVWHPANLHENTSDYIRPYMDSQMEVYRDPYWEHFIVVVRGFSKPDTVFATCKYTPGEITQYPLRNEIIYNFVLPPAKED